MSTIRKSRFTAALMWALVPLTVFASVPRVGCICANGDHKFFCQRHSKGDAQGRCSCCYGHAKSKPSSDDGVPACCQCSAKGCDKVEAGMRSERPCRPVVDKTVYVKAAKPTFNLDRADWAPLVVSFEPLPVIVRDFEVELRYGELLPPPDLVTTLGVLLI